MRLLLIGLLLTAAAAGCRREPELPVLPIGGDFVLTDHNGQPFDTASLRGKVVMVFFGYTFCPDICPTTMAQMRELKGLLPPEARDNLRIVFVSVDPNRDTPQQMKQYIGYFDPTFVGITADLPTLQKLANAVSIPFIPADTSKENYTVDHSGNLVVLGPDGTQRGFIRSPLNNQKLKDQLPGLVSPKS